MSPSIIGWRKCGGGMCGEGVWIGCEDRVWKKGVWRGCVEIVCGLGMDIYNGHEEPETKPSFVEFDGHVISTCRPIMSYA